MLKTLFKKILLGIYFQLLGVIKIFQEQIYPGQRKLKSTGKTGSTVRFGVFINDVT